MPTTLLAINKVSLILFAGMYTLPRPRPRESSQGSSPRRETVLNTTPTPSCGYHNNWGLLSGQSRQLPVEKLSHIPAATVPTDYRVEGQLRSRQHRLALGHYFHPASPHPTVPRVKDTVLVDERVPLGGQNEELGNHGRSGE